METTKRMLESVATVFAALFLLQACDDGVSCDMDPDQADCPDEDWGGGPGEGGFDPPTSTPTPEPSQGVRINGVNGSVYSGETVFVAVKMQFTSPNEPLAFCGSALIGSAGNFTLTFEGPVLLPGYGYTVDVLADLDGSGGLTPSEPSWNSTFATPASPNATSSDVAFDFAAAYLGSWTYWGETACAP